MRQPNFQFAVLSSLCCCVLLLAPGCASSGGDEGGKGDPAGEASPEGSPKQAAASEGDPSGSAGRIAGRPVDGPQKVGSAGEVAADNDEYTLRIDAGEGKVGEPGKVSMHVVPKSSWHLNLEYPTSLQIVAPEGVSLAQPKLGKDDAVSFGEEGCEFAISYTADAAGEKTFTGTFKFAVCQDEACAPRTEEIEFKVAVK